MPRQSLIEQALASSLQHIIKPLLGTDKDMTLLENNPMLQAQEMEKCKANFPYWSGKYFRTFDPRIEDPEKRECTFSLYPKQLAMHQWSLERVAKKQVGLVQKSRDSGVSVYYCAWGLHSWLFEQGFVGGYGSHIEEKLDKLGDMSSLMEKIRFAIRKLPKWMLPKGLNFDKHLMHRRIINPANNSILMGEIGDQIGRGGRASRYVIDEASFLDHPELVEASLTANTPIRFLVSTPNGLGNWFHGKSRSLPPEQVFSYFWFDDPRKNDEWKQKIIDQDGILVFEREYNLNYAASVEGICIPSAWVMSAVNLPLLAEGDVVCGFDVAGEGDNLNSIAPRQGPVVMPLRTWKGVVPADSANIAMRHAEELKAVKVCYDCLGPGEAIKAAWDMMAKDAEQGGAGLPFDAVPIIGGEQPTDFVWSDGKTSKQKFRNLRAELWWSLRVRFQKTHEYVQWLQDPTKGAFHPPEELISIPNDDQLINELSTPLIQPVTSGKIQIESKPQMRKRGVRSPDKADSVAYAFFNGGGKRKFWFF